MVFAEQDDAERVRFADTGISNLSIGILHLGPKTRHLEEAGFRSVGDIWNVDAAEFMRIPAVGSGVVDTLVRSRRALREAAEGTEAVDWEAYCGSIGIPLIPVRPPGSGNDFVESIKSFLECVAQAVDDSVLSSILFDRICKPSAKQKTLEEIATAATPALTRERVRQKERKLLSQITGGLLNDRYDGLEVHFHPGFARWWQNAADALSAVEEIDAGSFVKLLADVWSVQQATVMEQLPAIVAIVTGEPQMATGFRALATIDPRLFADSRQDLYQLPVLKLRVGKAAVRLAEAGMPLVGEVIESLRSGGIERIGVKAATRVTDDLNLLASCLRETGLDWEHYRISHRLQRFPPTPPTTALDFVQNLAQDVEQLLRAHCVSKRAADIFVLRTGRDVRERMTLQRVSESLGAAGPSIKREETVLLAWLNDVLVSREFWRLDVWLDSAWLTWWADALEVFERSSDHYDTFSGNLVSRWRVSARDMRAAVPALWAVFTGYPDGRRSAYSRMIPTPETAAATGRIRLQGFRRVH